MTDWMGLFSGEMRDRLADMGESGYRAGQIFSWLSRGVDFGGMTDLPKRLRDEMAASWSFPARILRREGSGDGETVKYLFRMEDGQIVEGVLLRYNYGNTLCVSAQVGCAMGCAFCASGLEGLERDVTAGEMLAMTALVNAERAEGGRRGVTNVVLMGSGEPLMNYDNTVRFVRLAAEGRGLGISPRNVSLSTCGVVEGIEALAGEGLPLTLSLSLHAPNDEIRRRIMPVADRYTVDETLAACGRYVDATGRRMIVEYTMIRNLNDAPEHARELAAKLRAVPCHVNLIPLNPVVERAEFAPPTNRAVRVFAKALEDAGASATVRRALGGDVQGACGQLRRRHMDEVRSWRRVL